MCSFRHVHNSTKDGCTMDGFVQHRKSYTGLLVAAALQAFAIVSTCLWFVFSSWVECEVAWDSSSHVVGLCRPSCSANHSRECVAKCGL